MRKAIGPWAISASLVVLGAGCKFESTATPATQVVVDIDAEPRVRAKVDEVTVHVASAKHRDNLDERVQTFEEKKAAEAAPEGTVWPLRMVFTPLEGDPRRVFELSATAVDADGKQVAQARVITGYVRHEIRYVKLVLEDDCIGIMCGELETCRVGGCAPAFVDPDDLPLLPWPDEGATDAGDAGVDASDAGEDSGIDAGHDAGDSGPPPIDPCLRDNGGCDQRVLCQTIDGVPTCGQCPNGFVDVNGNGSRCEDVDECAQPDKGGCDAAHGVCTNTPGGHDCACEAGYHGDGRECTVNVPCNQSAAVCDPLATCQQIQGQKVCQCKTGYEGDGGRGQCLDVDECTRNTGNCPAHSTCNNSEGAFSCACDSGWEKPSNGENVCNDVNECTRGTDNCDATPDACQNIDGSFMCQCPAGYMGTGVGDSCLDVDECAGNTDACDDMPDACVNDVGGALGYHCTCPAGYSGTGMGVNGCAEIDQCTLNTDTCDDMPDACVNDVGGLPGFHCTCPMGYSGTGVGGTGCAEIDQCTLNTDTCDDAPDACVNDVGGLPGFHCTCPAGYSGTGVGGTGCTEIDQCMLNTDDCSATPDACVNDVGGLPGFHCTCPAGYSGTGVGATGCTEIDQCMLNTDTCSATPDACVNDLGGLPGFHCTCPAGFTGTGIGATGCTQTNECSSSATNTCDDNPVACVDDPGGSPGFHCTCPDGYSGTGVGAGGCVEIDQCAAHTDNCDDVPDACVNDIGGLPGFHCTCPAGYTGSGVGDTCTDIVGCPSGNSFCMNGGTCVDETPPGTGHTCNCATVCGFNGPDCGTTIPRTPFGLTSGTAQAIPAQTLYAVKVMGVAAASKLVAIKMSGAVGTGQVRLGVYENAGTAPGARVAEIGPIAIAASYSVSCTTLTAGGTYWIAVESDQVLTVNGTAGGTAHVARAGANDLPTPFGGTDATPVPDADLALSIETIP